MLLSPSVQFSCSVISDSLRPHELQHARPPCPSPTPGVHSDSCPLSLWCHPAISSLVVPFSSCPQSLPASESFPMSQLLAWGGQSTGILPGASVENPTHGKGHKEEAWWAKARSSLEGPPGPARASTPKPESVCLTMFMPFTNSSDNNRELSPTTFLWKKINLGL